MGGGYQTAILCDLAPAVPPVENLNFLFSQQTKEKNPGVILVQEEMVASHKEVTVQAQARPDENIWSNNLEFVKI